MNKWNLTIGESYLWQDKQVKIQRFLDQNLVLVDEYNQMTVIAIAEFIRDQPAPIRDEVVLNPEPLLEAIATPLAIKKAHALQEHLEVAINGHDSKKVSQVFQEYYDPAITTLTQRMKTKAAEMGMQLSALWKLKKRYEQSGLVGLLDGRTMLVQRGARLGNNQPLYLSIKAVLESASEESKLSRKILRNRIEKRLIEDYASSAKLPSISTLNRLILAIERELGLQGTARQRQKRQLEPKGVFGQVRATRPGQTVLIDSTVLDMFCVDPKTMEWTRVILIVAFDIYSRSIVSWRFIPESAKALDAALMLFDILHPKPASKDWPDIALWRYFGVPDEIWVVSRNGEPETESPVKDQVIAGIPFGKPQTIVIDHDRVYISKTLQHVCMMLGISIQRARIRRPTDKSMVENVFRHISRDFAGNLPGYKGSDVPSRGINVEEKAFYFVEEVDAMFAEWVATYWQNHTSRTLTLPGAPSIHMTPNEMYAEGIAKAGLLPIPNLSYFDCLETEYRQVDKQGILVDYLYYDSADLNLFRNKKSRITSGAYVGKYPVKVDPRDRSQIYFFDEYTEEWLLIPWRGASIFPKPFSEISLAFVKKKVADRLSTTKPDDGDYARALKAMYARWEDNRFTDGRERRAYGRSETLIQQAAKDRVKTKAQTKPAKQPPAPLEEWIEDDVAMPPATKIRVERFSQSRSPYERFQEEETKTSTDPEGDDEI